jgi:hypothetical protein
MTGVVCAAVRDVGLVQKLRFLNNNRLKTTKNKEPTGFFHKSIGGLYEKESRFYIRIGRFIFRHGFLRVDAGQGAFRR